MSRISGADLTNDEIEEELLNNEIIHSGGIEDEEGLQDMNVEEKKNLLKGIQQSKEEYHNEAGAKSSSQSLFDSPNFPSLPSVGKTTSLTTRNRLKLPRKSGALKIADSDISDKSITDEGETVMKFTLPYFKDDGAPPLPIPQRAMPQIKNLYCVMAGETPAAALNRMLNYHEQWKTAYEMEMRRKSSHLFEDTNEPDVNDLTGSPKLDEIEDKENDPYEFDSSSPLRTTARVYGGMRRREPAGAEAGASSRTLQRKASRDSDCEEVEPILKPDAPKLNDWITATPRQKNKRNRKQLLNAEKAAQTYEASADVEFDFDKKWDAGSSSWRGSPAGQPRRLLPQTPIDEEKVQCPICQQDFRKSKVEAHAATCEGYSPSYMDVEEGN